MRPRRPTRVATLVLGVLLTAVLFPVGIPRAAADQAEIDRRVALASDARAKRADRMRAAHELGGMGKAAAPALIKLMDLRDVERSARHALVRIGADAVPALAAALADPGTGESSRSFVRSVLVEMGDAGKATLAADDAAQLKAQSATLAKGPDAEARVKAAKQLIERALLGDKAAGAVVVESLRSGNRDARVAALQALAQELPRRPRDGDALLPALMAQLRDGDPQIRQVALETVNGMRGFDKLPPYALEALSSRHAEVRHMGVLILTDQPGHAMKSLSRLKAMARNDPDETVRMAAARAVRETGIAVKSSPALRGAPTTRPGNDPRMNADVARVSRVLASFRDTEKLAKAAEEAGRFGPEGAPTLAPHLVRLLGHQDDNVRGRAFSSLQAMRVAALPALLDGMRAGAGDVPRWCEALLTAITTVPPEHGPALKRAANDKDPAVRKVVAKLLARLDDPDVRRSTLAAGLSDADVSVRLTTLRQMQSWGPEQPVGEIARLLKDDVPGVRRQAALTLQFAGPAAGAALPALAQTATDEDAGVREAAEDAAREIQRSIASDQKQRGGKK